MKARNTTTCANEACNKKFEATQKGRRFCSPKCKAQSYNREHPRCSRNLIKPYAKIIIEESIPLIVKLVLEEMKQ